MKNQIEEVWKIEKLRSWEKNPKTVEEEDFARLKRQIKKFGLYKPLVITKDGVVLGGNSRLRALKELGEKLVWVYVVSAPTEREMLAYAFSDNDASGKWENAQLAQLISEMKIDPESLSDYRVDAGFLLEIAKQEVEREEDAAQTDSTREAYEANELKQIVLFLDTSQKQEVELFIEQLMDAQELPDKEAALLFLLDHYEDHHAE